MSRGVRHRPRGPRRPQRRGLVIVAVIVVVATVMLIASGMVARAASDRAALAGEERRIQQRIAAWSGVRAMMMAVSADREGILDGLAPASPADEAVLWEAGGQEWIVRLLPLGAAGETIVAEAGKLDLSLVTSEDLLATGVLDPDSADAIIAARDRAAGRRPVAVAELAAARGVDPETVLGPLDEIRTISAGAGLERDVAERVLDRLSAGRLEAITDLLTVHAVEPALQRDGTRRIVLPETWSDELGERLNERFGEGAATSIRQLLEAGVRFDGTAAIVGQLVRFDVPPADWGPFLDALTGDPADESVGRLDLNTASVPALRTLPGMTEEAAQAITDARSGLSAEERWTIAWPVMRGILEPEAFQGMADRLTTRCFTWRMRVAVGRRSLEADPGDPLRDVTVLEAVVDLAAPQPRLAELRDVTHLELAARLLLAARDEMFLAGNDELGGADRSSSGSGDGDGAADEPDPGRPAFDFDDPFVDSPVPEATVGFGDGGLVDAPDPASGDESDPMASGTPMSPAPEAGGSGSSSGGAAARRRGARWLGPGGG